MTFVRMQAAIAQDPQPSAEIDSAAFQSVVQRFEKPLIGYAMRIVHDRERAQDIVQDTFLRLFESDVDVDDPRLRSWLFTVCRNRAIDFKRRERRVTHMDEPPELAVEASGEHRRQVTEVFECLDDLPSKKARVLKLRYKEDQSYREIAETTGMTVSHVGVVIHDCIRMLRHNLAVVVALGLVVGAGAWGATTSADAGRFSDSDPPGLRLQPPLLVPFSEVLVGTPDGAEDASGKPAQTKAESTQAPSPALRPAPAPPRAPQAAPRRAIPRPAPPTEQRSKSHRAPQNQVDHRQRRDGTGLPIDAFEEPGLDEDQAAPNTPPQAAPAPKQAAPPPANNVDMSL